MRRTVWHFFSASKTRCDPTMPRSAAGKAKRRRRQQRDDRRNDFLEESEEEKEDEEEKRNIEDIVRTEFEGDAHRALFAMIVGTKRHTNGRDDDGEREESDEEEEGDDEEDDEESESEESDEARRGELVLDPEDGEDIDDVNKVLEWEPIPEETQKRLDQMGPQDDVSDISSSDTEVEKENPKGGEKEAKKRSLNANDVEYEDRDNALTLHLKKCQNEDEKTGWNTRQARL